MQTDPKPTAAEPALDLAILYRRERAFVRRALLSLGVAASGVDDVIQDVFLVVFRRLSEYDQRRGTMRAWLFGIAMRVAANQRRRSRPRTLPPALDIHDATLGDPERYVARLGDVALADRLISSVPEEQWVPFVMAEVEGMSAAEIADALGLQVATVYTRIHRARKRLDRERGRMVERPSTIWALLVARFDEWTRPRPLATAAFVSMRVAIAIGLTVLVLAALAVFVTRAPARNDDATPLAPTTAGVTSVHADDSSRGRDDRDDDLAAAGPATIAGRVTTPAGPHSGAHVCAWPEPSTMEPRSNAPQACASSDTHGRYELRNVRPGRWVVTASAPAWAPASHRPPPPATVLALRGGERRDGIDIAFVDSGMTQRIVVRDVTGGPIEGALVFASSDRSGTSAAKFLARPPGVGESNAEGVVELSVRPGWMSLRARADGYAEGTRNGNVPSPAVEIVLAPESAIAGRVVSDGEPVAGAIVTAMIQYGPFPERAALVESDAQGHFRLSGLSPGNYRVHARADGRYGEVPNALALGFAEHIEDVVIETASAGSLHARVEFQESGEPCKSGFVALLVNGSMVMDQVAIASDGVVEFSALVPATYEPYVYCDLGAAKDRYDAVVVTGIDDVSATWRVDAGATVQGRVHDHAGKALANAEVQLMGNGPWRSAMTEVDGRYEIVGMRAGAYQLEARRDGLSTSGSEPIEIGSGVVTRDLELLAPGRLVGRVVDRSGKGIANAFIEARRATTGNLSWWQMGTGVSDRAGDFSLEIDPGRWLVTAEVDGVPSEGKLVEVDVESSRSFELVVDSRRGTVRGRVVEGDGSPVADAVVVAQAVGDPARARAVLDAMRANAELVRGRVVLTDDDGRFQIEVGAGSHVVLARRRGGGEAWKLAVEIGADVKLVVAEESVIAGTVRAPDGTPPGRMNVRVASAELGLRREEAFVLGGGRFRIEGLPAGRYVVTARAPEGTGRTEITLGEGEVAAGLSIALVPGAPKTGRLVDVDTGEPIPGIIVAWGSTDESAQELSMRAALFTEVGDPSTRSDADGRFTLPAVTGDAVRLGAIPANILGSPYGPTAVEVPLAGDALPDVPLVRPRVGGDEVPGTFGLEFVPPPDFCTESLQLEKVSGPAAAAGLRAGDTIIAIDGHDVSGWRCYLVGRMLAVKVDTSVTFTLGRGDTVALTASKS